MRCPYCVTEIAEEALVCPQCTRELYLFKPLLEKIGQLERTTAEQTKGIAALEAELAALKAERAQAIPVEIVAEVPAAPEPERSGYPLALVQALVPALVLLVAAHGLLLFVYDVKPLILRIATLVIPIPFGVLLALHHPGRLAASATSGFAMAALAVLGMLIVTATIDKVPILPQDARDARETLEYVVGIGLAFTTGAMIGEFLPAFREKGSPPHRVMLLVARAITPDEEGKLGIEKAAKKIDKLVKAATPAATGAASLYAGVKAFLGGLG